MGNTKVQKYFYYTMLLIMLVSIIVPCIRLLLLKAPEAVNGTLDLKTWDAVKDETIPLNGEWEFYFGKLLTSDDFQSALPSGGTMQKVPEQWNHYKINRECLPAHGFATYRLKLLLPENQTNYGIKVTSIFTSARIFVDGREVLACGKPGESFETTVHECYADTAYFNTDKHEVELIIQVANFIYSNSGIYYKIYFGSQKAITSLRMYQFFRDAALISGMFFISLYFLCLGLMRKNKSEVIYFALYCLSSAVQESVRSETILSFAFPAITFGIKSKILTATFLFCLYFLFKFIQAAIRGKLPRKADKGFEWFLLFFILLTFFTNFYLWEHASIIIILGNVYVFVIILSTIFRHNRKEMEGVYYLYTAVISSVIFLILKLLNTVIHFESSIIIPVFQPIFILSLALYMSVKYENSYRMVEKLSNRLANLDKLKDDFLAKTSHELKTPLNGIINITQSLLDGAGGSLNAAQTDDLQLISSIGRRLSTIVYDLLDYSKLKVMDIQLRISPVDVYQVIEPTAEIFRYLTKGKPVIIENKIPPITYLVMADENRLKQIVSNLLDNAVKFTPQGSITIDCHTVDSYVFIEVRDTGVGIPENKLKDIFTSYEQLENSSSIASGTGLGLAITKQLVELHKGQICAASEFGKGSCFTFSIPLSKSGHAIESAAGDQEEGMLQSNYTEDIMLPQTVNTGGEFSILVVDDEYSNLKALLNILTNWKHNVTIAGNGESALSLLSKPLKYDLCILDVMMPGMCGYEACQKIRTAYSPLELPVLILTAKNLSEDVEAGFIAGANDYIEKPFETSELKCRVDTLVQLKKSMNLIIEKETAFLQAQIKPHFLFNALNTVNSLCYTNPSKAGELLSQLGVFLRNCFDFSSTTSYVKIEKELSLVKAYVAIEQARFGKQLEVEYNVKPAVLKYSIIPLTIQPIVENSIRHGLMKRNGGGKVTLNLTFHEEQIYVQVIDNGIGIQKHILNDLATSKLESSGVGLTNINRRLLNCYGVTLDISSTENMGTTITFCIPANYS